MATSQKLPSKYAKIAKAELGEDPKNTPAHLEAFRRWLSSMPHLTCPDDEEFLIMFLRHCKFSHAKAQARLDNFCTLSTMKCIGEEIWSTPLDLESKELRKYLDSGIHLPIGYTEEGRAVMCLRLGEWNPDEFPFPRLYYYAYKAILMVASDPRTIIGGTIIILNFANVTSNQVLKDPNVIRAMVRFSQEALPGRVKRVIIYNEGKIINTALSIFTFYMKDKAKSRMIHVGPDLSKAFEVEPGLQAILPPEYGGDGKPLDDLIKDNKKHFYEFYGKRDLTSEIKVDESKRPVSARAYLREYKDYDPNVMGTSGTYIKINQDEI